MKTADLRPGVDRLTDFQFWDCMPKGAVRIVYTCDLGLYVKCREGQHFLDGATEESGDLSGCEVVAADAGTRG